ncbi:hypothetical protein XY58_14540 [Stenotrophomonas maltophilia]|nr:hypothetical protein XY58_14540 [Stenotrophomonas maltophilia]
MNISNLKDVLLKQIGLTKIPADVNARDEDWLDHLCRVLDQAEIAHLGVAELPLDHLERMLDLRAQTSLAALPALNLFELTRVANGEFNRRIEERA